MADFLMAPDDPGMQRYFGKIADFMVSEFGISRAEAVARINEAYKDITFQPYPDIMCHELPEFWGWGLYYGDVPYWDEHADRSQWRVRPAPPRDSVSWTLAPPPDDAGDESGEGLGEGRENERSAGGADHGPDAP
ncbi:hypothetical protein RM844_11335 [Streptomyces sp. DSM 44915]|uniref:Uncharacterized protein n=1 Tax=Streptomyces chisholmiae TaxID=3075540 RepID=A0ABU2JQU0_9ACTN|nr:hypothetical protein [Streptomyces sp. DSM 44915]MDT0266884.1 hypothetical protein [Streptomyces sp. DSM 44915]